MKKAIVTLIIGQYYQNRWEKFCASNWHRYAELHGYDIVCLNRPLDQSERAQSRSPAWQKCLILSEQIVQAYDRVVWIDSDILINPYSPCILVGVPEEKVGAVEMFTGPLGELMPGNKYLIEREIEFFDGKLPYHDGKEFYRNAGLPDTFSAVVQTGVMVVSPRYHRSIFEQTYYNYENNPNAHFEMESLSYELVKANCVHWIDERFNKIWLECMLRDYPFLLPKSAPENILLRALKRLIRGRAKLPPRKITTLCVTTAFQNNYFLHFAGTANYDQYMAWTNTSLDDWNDLRGKL